MNYLAQFDAFGIDKAAHGFFHIRGVKRFDIGQSLLQRRQQLTSVRFANSFLKGLFVVAQIIVRYEEASPLGHTLFAVRSLCSVLGVGDGAGMIFRRDDF